MIMFLKFYFINYYCIPYLYCMMVYIRNPYSKQVPLCITIVHLLYYYLIFIFVNIFKIYICNLKENYFHFINENVSLCLKDRFKMFNLLFYYVLFYLLFNFLIFMIIMFNNMCKLYYLIAFQILFIL